jgi:hypothetical protein
MAVLLDIIWQRNAKTHRTTTMNVCLGSNPPPITPTDADYHPSALLASIQLLLKRICPFVYCICHSVDPAYPVIAAVFGVVWAYPLVNANFGDK